MNILYGVVLALHALAALVGFGALGATGAYARAARNAPARAVPVSVRRYFAPGRNGAALVLFAVPLLGFVLLAMHHFRDAGRPFPWVGLGLWSAAALLAALVLWPAERAIQQLLQDPHCEVADAHWQRSLDRACRTSARAAAMTSLCFVAALFFMVVQPF